MVRHKTIHMENVVERALILNPEGPLRFDDLLQMSAHTPAAHAADEDWRTLDAMTADYIRRVLSKTNGRINGKGGAAEILGIHPNTLRHRMRKLGIVFGRK